MRLRVAFLAVYSMVAASHAAPIIDLTQKCDSQGCIGRAWFVKAGFDGPQEHDASWKKVDSFPAIANKIVPIPGTLGEWTFQTSFDLPPEFDPEAAPPGIRFGQVGQVFSIYLNGKLVASEGRTDGNRVIYDRTLRKAVFPFSSSLLRPTGNQLVVRIAGDPRYPWTGFYHRTGNQVGSYPELRRDSEDRLGLGLVILYLGVGLYHFLLYVRRRVEQYNLWFGTFCVLIFAYLFLELDLVNEWSVDQLTVRRTKLTFLYPLPIVFILFLNHLFSFTTTWVIRAYAAFIGVLVILLWTVPAWVLGVYVLRVWEISTLLVGVPFGIARPIQAIRRKKPEGKWILVGLILFIASGVADIVDSLFFNFGGTLARYGFLTFILGIAALLANRFLRLHNEVEDLNTNLEENVRVRTMELKRTLDEVKDLKEQQDGDYFLTAELVRPLMGNFANQQVVSSSIFVRQKKAFTFKKWNTELGGDLCTTGTVILKGKTFFVFFNADAMGKSMQGAGGLIALGTIFKAFLTRTQESAHASNRFPEQWLKDCFTEIQNIFTGFDGTMLASAILGLIDEATGVLYLVNAEHPWPVLYRNGTSMFVLKDKMVHKLGLSSMGGNSLCVGVMRLLPGDVLVVGSDGRDDLALGTDEDGQRVINQDESLFLKIVTDAIGDLEQIVRKLETTGEITDDISLLRIGYAEDTASLHNLPAREFRDAMKKAKAAISSNQLDNALEYLHIAESNLPGQPSVAKLFAQVYLKKKDHNNAAHWCLQYAVHHPEDTRVLQAASRSLKHLGGESLPLAADLGECCRLREPASVSNLVHLAHTYTLMKNFQRAKMLIGLALRQEPHNSRALRLSSAITSIAS